MEKQIIELRKSGLTYNEISEKLNVTISKVKYWCRKNNIKLENEYENNIKLYLQENFPNLIMTSRYINSYTEIQLQCLKCNEKFSSRPDSIKDIRNGKPRFKGCYKCRRKKYICECCGEEIGVLKEIKFKYGPGENRRYYCSEECLNISENKECKICGSKFLPTILKNACSDRCNEQLKELLHQETLKKSLEERRLNFKSETRICKYCGEKFETTLKRQRTVYCSDVCGKKNHNRNKEIKRRHKIRENGNINWDITLPKLYEKHNGICAICGEKCNYDDYIENKEGYFIARDDYPSIDHIIPVAKGGTHTWSNVQLAHRKCNSIKNDGFIEEEGQLRII